jgi:hypothetical protein
MLYQSNRADKSQSSHAYYNFPFLLARVMYCTLSFYRYICVKRLQLSTHCGNCCPQLINLSVDLYSGLGEELADDSDGSCIAPAGEPARAYSTAEGGGAGRARVGLRVGMIAVAFVASMRILLSHCSDLQT